MAARARPPARRPQRVGASPAGTGGCSTPSPPDRELHAEPLTSMMQHSHFALSPDWDDAVEWLATRTLGPTSGGAPTVPTPREDVVARSPLL